MTSELEKIVLYSLSVFKLSIVLNINDKLVVLNPRILEDVDLSKIAESLSASELTEEDILEGLRVIDEARSPKIPDIKGGSRN